MIRSLSARQLSRATLVLLMVLALTWSAAAADLRLVNAVKSGDKAAVSSLIQQRVDVNASEPDGTAALHWAVRADDLELADRLIQAGANPKLANRYGITPLYLASLNGSASMISRLLKAGVDPNATSTEGETALMTAARTGNIEAARVLLAGGARVDAKDAWQGQTALMWATAQKHPEMVKLLLDAGADVNARSVTTIWERQNTAEPREKWMPLGSLTPLMFAAREGCAACVPVLAKAGGDVNAADIDDNLTPLITALLNGHYDTALALIESGADIHLSDKPGRTPLYSAVDAHTMPMSNRPSPKETDNEASSLDVIKVLLARGAEVNVPLKSQQPCRTKLDRGTDGMLGAGTTPLIRAAKAGDHVAMRLLLEKDADPNLATRAGITALMAAAGVGTNDADITGRFKTQAEIIESIKLCLDKGADIHAADSNGRTAVFGAAQMGYNEVVEFLAQRGAKLDIKDSRGRTPLDAAMGLAGGAGFDGTSGVAHESTVATLKRLLAATPNQENR
jgi:ankyrin repeat protein